MIVMIVLNYNDCITTKEYVNIAKDYKSIDKIVIVDNCSTDTSFSNLSKLASKKVDVIQTDENKGYAYGNNFGVRFAANKYPELTEVIISNPDIEVLNQDIKILRDCLHIEPDLFAVTGQVYNAEGKLARNFAWKHTSYLMLILECSFLCSGFLRKVFKYSKYYDKFQDNANTLMQVDVLPGCFFMVDYYKWKVVGGFDESTFLYFEEDILFAKSIEKGFQSAVVKNAKIIHREGTTIRKNIDSWNNKENIIRASSVAYIKTALRMPKICIGFYIIVFNIFKIERYAYTRIKHIFTFRKKWREYNITSKK